jgi:hypothetical protein
MDEQTTLTWLRDTVGFNISTLPTSIHQGSFAQGRFLAREYITRPNEAIFRPLCPNPQADITKALNQLWRQLYTFRRFYISEMPFTQQFYQFRLISLSQWCDVPIDLTAAAIGEDASWHLLYNTIDYGTPDARFEAELKKFLFSIEAMDTRSTSSHFSMMSAKARDLQRQFEKAQRARVSGGQGKIEPSMRGISAELNAIIASCGSWKDVIRLRSTNQGMREVVREFENIIAHTILKSYNVTELESSWRPVSWDAFFAGFELPWTITVIRNEPDFVGDPPGIRRQIKLIHVWYGSLRQFVQAPLTYVRDVGIFKSKVQIALLPGKKYPAQEKIVWTSSPSERLSSMLAYYE